MPSFELPSAPISPVGSMTRSPITSRLYPSRNSLTMVAEKVRVQLATAPVVGPLVPVAIWVGNTVALPAM